MRFQGQHKDQLCVTYKSEGDGVQTEALCNEGFTYDVYIRNDPEPKSSIK